MPYQNLVYITSVFNLYRLPSSKLRSTVVVEPTPNFAKTSALHVGYLVGLQRDTLWFSLGNSSRSISLLIVGYTTSHVLLPTGFLFDRILTLASVSRDNVDALLKY